jgi:hypothetical protein
MFHQANFAKRQDCRRCRKDVQEVWRVTRNPAQREAGTYCDRWEAEEQQHKEYLDKMKRVEERRKANLEKQAEVSDCMAESPDSHILRLATPAGWRTARGTSSPWPPTRSTCRSTSLR